jgi:S1-C subfamily serine protease
VRLERLCVGRVTVRVTLPGCLVGERVGAVPAGRVATLERLEVRAGGGAEGDVVDARGEPVQGARVQRADAPVEAPDGVLTAREGRFLAASLPEGDVALVATHPALGRSAPTVVRVLRGTVARGVRLRFATDLASATLALEASALELVETRLGVLVRAVREDTPMAAAGVREGDRVVSVNAVAVTTAAQAERLLRLSRGDQTVLELERDGARRAVRWAR